MTAYQHLGTALLIAAGLGSPPEAMPQQRIAVIEEQAGTAVALSVVVSAGSALEPPGQNGLTALTGQALLEELQPRVAALGGQASMTCGRTEITFTLVVPANGWRVASELFVEGILHGETSEAALRAAHRALSRRVEAATGNPVAEIRNALDLAMFSGDRRWSQPACGTPDGLARVDPEAVHRLARTRFVASRASAAMAGPVDGAAATRLLRDLLDDPVLPILHARPSPSASDGRRFVERNTVTTWIGMSFPFQGEADHEALRLLAFRVWQESRPAPARPEVYDADTVIERHGGDGTLIVLLAVRPDATTAWSDRLDNVVRDLAAEPMVDGEFAELMTRYRGHRFRELASPEARSIEAARQLFYHGEYVPPVEAVDALSPERLHRAARQLGSPAVAILGPH